MKAADFDIELTGFTEDDFLDEDDIDDSMDAENQCPELDERQPVVTVQGDVWQLGKHRLFCGTFEGMQYERQETTPDQFKSDSGDGTTLPYESQRTQA